MSRVKQSALWVMCAISISLFFSCLGESGNWIRFCNRRAVVQENPRKSLWVRDDSIPQGYLISSPEFEMRDDLREGDCCLVEYRIDYGSSPEQGIYPAEIWRCDTIAKIPLVQSPVDTLNVLDHEQFVTLAFDKSLYMKGRYFMQINLSDYQPTRKDLFTFTYDPQQAKNSSDENNPVYHFYLRSYKDQELDTIRTESMIVQKAFVLDQFLDEIGKAEKNKGADSLRFVINYPRGFNMDATALLWTETDTFSISLF